MEVQDSGISFRPSYRQLTSELRFESKRLQTFQDWPIDAPIESARVAKAGFFFTGHGCEVQCFACSGKVLTWDYGDQAILKHRQMNPSCPFILNRSSNVPLGSAEVNDNAAERSSNLSLVTGLPTPSQPIPHANNQPLDTLSGSSPDESHSEGYSSDHTPHTPSVDNTFVLPRAYNEPVTGGPSHAVTESAGNHSVSGYSAELAQTDRANRPYLSHQEWLQLRREDIRLRSYDSRFSSNFMSPLSLAKAGFFYLGVDDQVQCAFCRGIVRDWESGDDPKQEHKRLFPSCAFTLGLPVGNIPLGEEPTNRSVLERTASIPVPGSGFGVSPTFTPQMRPSASPDTDIEPSPHMQLNALIGDNLEALGIRKHSGPRYPMYATLESRLKSFANRWPTHLKQTPHDMAQAGFFYLGTNDHVNCFHCGSGLRCWLEDDDAWLEHARWFPQCRYVILMKGEQFVKEATDSAPSLSDTARARSKAPSSRSTSPREISETEIQSLLESTIAQTVLSMGVDPSRVKQAYQYQIRTTGRTFNSVDSLLEAALQVQHYSEMRQAMEDGTYENVEWPEARHTTRRYQVSEESSLSDNSENIVPIGQISLPEVVVPPKPEDSIQMETSEPAITNESPGSDRTHVLEEEIRRLKEARLCKVCLDEEVSIAYIPCGHIVTCIQCAAALDQCPLCRKNIKGTVRIFFS